MLRFNLLTGAAVAGLLIGATGARAADMPVYYEEPVAFGGWYLRGDVGASHQQVDDIDNALYDTADSVQIRNADFDPSWFIGLGVGYQFNQWFRADITGEFRGKSDFDGLDFVTTGGVDTINDFDTDKTEWTFLANVYWDIGTWHSITPFIGAGIGASYNRIGDLTDTNLAAPAGGAFCPTNGCADANGEWQLAWALHAGLAFAVTPNMAIEIAYRYLHLGDAESGDIYANDGTNAIDNPLEFKDLSSHDIKLGLRYTFN